MRRRTLLAVAATMVAMVGGGTVPEAADPPSAKDIAREWRYPGTGSGPGFERRNGVTTYTANDTDVLCLETCRVAAPLDRVWSHYARRCRFESAKPSSLHMVMKKLDGGERPGAQMAVDLGIPRSGTEFALHTDGGTVHVTLRRRGEDQTDVHVLVAVR